MKRFPVLAAACAALLAAAPLAAQPAQYRRDPADTRRYVEATTGTVTMRVLGREAVVESEHGAHIAVTFAGGDGARAWYESLHLLQLDPTGEVSAPETEALLHQPYTLVFRADGAVRTAAVPPIPEEIADMSDLTHQFLDFFISLPDGPLAVGAAWADTLVDDRAGRPRDTYSGRQVRTFRVERDTVVDGVDAVVIRVSQRVTVRASSLMEDGMKVSGELKGTEEGFAVFAPREGVLLSRSREGVLSGTMRMMGPETVSIPQRYEYTSTLELVEPRPGADGAAPRARR